MHLVVKYCHCDGSDRIYVLIHYLVNFNWYSLEFSFNCKQQLYYFIIIWCCLLSSIYSMSIFIVYRQFAAPTRMLPFSFAKSKAYRFSEVFILFRSFKPNCLLYKVLSWFNIPILALILICFVWLLLLLQVAKSNNNWIVSSNKSPQQWLRGPNAIKRLWRSGQIWNCILVFSKIGLNSMAFVNRGFVSVLNKVIIRQHTLQQDIDLII